MSKTLRIHKAGQTIDSVERWFQFAPPMGKEKHWHPGRSAMEIAKAWFPDQSGKLVVPEELDRLLHSTDAFPGLRFEEGIPEYEVPLDLFRGGKRNTDLVLIGHSENGKVVISVEAKADEPFDQTLDRRLRTVQQKPESKVPDRINLMLTGLFSHSIEKEPDYADLRYQLLTGTAGALIEAKRREAQVAVFVVHEFVGNKSTKQKKLETNRGDFEDFARLLLQNPEASITSEKLYGPVDVPGGEFIPNDIPLYFGKIRRDLDVVSK